MRARAALRPLAVACAFAAAAGCAAIAGFEDLDFRETTGTGDGGMDGSGTDAAGEGGNLSDASTVPDALPDALPDAPIGCDGSSHDLCDDFSNPIFEGDGGWTAALNQVPGQFGRDTLNQELVVELLENDAGASGFNALRLDRPWAKRTSGERNDLVVQWRAKVETCPAYNPMVRVTVAPSNNRVVVDAVLRELDGLCWAKLVAVDIFDAGPSDYRLFENLYVPISVNEWHAFRFVLRQAADGRVTAALLVDDGGERAVTFATDSTENVFALFVGAYTAASQHGRLRFDDVRIDWTK